ncbi:MAG: hypothetical protein ISP90_02885 [Nevskia sp.]|nr:hypothetical protein [Nevskia sp.]
MPPGPFAVTAFSDISAMYRDPQAMICELYRRRVMPPIFGTAPPYFDAPDPSLDCLGDGCVLLTEVIPAINVGLVEPGGQPACLLKARIALETPCDGSATPVLAAGDFVVALPGEGFALVYEVLAAQIDPTTFPHSHSCVLKARDELHCLIWRPAVDLEPATGELPLEPEQARAAPMVSSRHRRRRRSRGGANRPDGG